MPMGSTVGMFGPKKIFVLLAMAVSLMSSRYSGVSFSCQFAGRRCVKRRESGRERVGERERERERDNVITGKNRERKREIGFGKAHT